jgi:hypothetical protein
MGDFFEAIEHTWLISHIATSNPVYGTLTAMHYFTLFIVVGTAVIMDLRLLNLVGTRQQLSAFADDIFPWIWTALGLAVFSGFSLWLTDAGDYWRAPAMNGKIVVVLLAIVDLVLVRKGIRKWDTEPGKWRSIALGFVVFSILVMWITPTSYFWKALPSIAKLVVVLGAIAIVVVLWLAARAWAKGTTPAAAKILAVISIFLFIIAILGGNNIAALCGLG